MSEPRNRSARYPSARPRNPLFLSKAAKLIVEALQILVVTFPDFPMSDHVCGCRIGADLALADAANSQDTGEGTTLHSIYNPAVNRLHLFSRVLYYPVFILFHLLT